MPWASLGSISLSWNWQTLSTPDVGGEVYRVIQRFRNDLIYPSGYFLFSWIYPDGGRHGIRRIWADNTQPIVLIFSIPQALKSKGFETRYPMLKLPSRARLDSTNPWRVEIQVETPIEQ
jgi:hypothetical protein